MPAKLQDCPFCHKQYANEKGLQDHLLQYTGSLRLPADGIHDVLKIKDLDFMKSCVDQEDEIDIYGCPPPSCAYTNGDWKAFAEHVVSCSHYTEDSWFPNRSEHVVERRKIWQPSGTFPFFKLPLEIREMIYQAVLTFQRINNQRLYPKTWPGTDVKQTSQGIYLQYNPPCNLLSLLAVNHQMYHEARRIFYQQNKFIFSREVEYIPIFLIGIGRQNALLIKFLSWPSGRNYDMSSEQKNKLDIIKPYIAQEETNIWNDEDQFMGLLQALVMSRTSQHVWTTLHQQSTHRVLRLDADDVLAGDGYERYKFQVICDDNDRRFDVAYELRTRSVKDDHPVRVAALQNLTNRGRC